MGWHQYGQLLVRRRGSSVSGEDISPLIDEQAVPIIIHYIDLAIENKIITEEHCRAVLEDLVNQTYLHYKETPAYLYFKEEGGEELGDTGCAMP